MAQEGSWTMILGGSAIGGRVLGVLVGSLDSSRGSVGAPMAIPEVRPLLVGPGLMARMILLGSRLIPTSNNVMDKG